MTTETTQGNNFVAKWLPWLLGAAMLAVYLFTLDHGIGPSSLSQLSTLKGTVWRPNIYGVVTILATSPLRLLPPAVLPVALNLFAAVCAALTLCLLARSVALLPHDKTQDQRQRDAGEFALLNIPTAWLPPLFAVLACGLQISFWENAIAGTGEMFDLLIFAYVIRCLLEYRVSARESWLYKFALVYGLGMANNWAMVGLFPLFLVALVWFKGISFFNTRFLLRVFGLGLLGFSLILVLPLVVGLHHSFHLSFWDCLHYLFTMEKQIFTGGVVPRDLFFRLAMMSILPILILAIRWPSNFGDSSPLGIFLATVSFHIFYAVMLGVSVWVALDTKFSPRHSVSGIPFLTFYYLSAISIGYFSGYFLLVFGTKASRHKSVHPAMQALNVGVAALVWVMFAGAITLFLSRNYPQIQTTRAVSNAYTSFFSRAQDSLPQKGAIVLSDDSFRLSYFQNHLDRQGKHGDYLLIDSGTLSRSKEYLRTLDKSHPDFNLAASASGILSSTNDLLGPDSLDLIKMLDDLSHSHPIYYMHPSYGYYFEKFYLEPHGVLYQLKLYATNAWTPPALTAAQIEENEHFWNDAMASADTAFLRGTVGVPSDDTPTLLQKLLQRLHLTKEPNGYAILLGTYYSRALNFWGVELQKTAHYKEAGQRFEQSAQLTPDNISARMNLAVNHKLAAGTKLTIDRSRPPEELFGNYRTWSQILDQFGPFDDPTFCYDLGMEFAMGRNYRQSVQQLMRVKTLVPDNVAPLLQLAQLHLTIQKFDSGISYLLPYSKESFTTALADSDDALRIAPSNPQGLFLRSAAFVQLGDFNKAVDSLSTLIANQTNNFQAIAYRAAIYFEMTNYEAARHDWETIGKFAPTNVAPSSYFGLAEIAYKQKDMAGAIKNYKLFLTNSPPGSEAAKTATNRLNELSKVQ